jgi:hypothetical protein
MQDKEDDRKAQPKPYKLRRYYIPADLEDHKTAFDSWVSFFHEVYDLTPLLHQHRGDLLCGPIIQAAGTDITHWFDLTSHEVLYSQPKTYIHPEFNLKAVYCPWGRYLHVLPAGPDAEFDNSFEVPWWRDRDRYCIGRLSRCPRKLRVINMLSKQDDIIQVASEETLSEILDRYLPLNDHAASYTWKRLGRPLDMELTLEENGIEDESREFLELDIDEDYYTPAVHLYYNDDLTVK